MEDNCQSKRFLEWHISQIMSANPGPFCSAAVVDCAATCLTDPLKKSSTVSAIKETQHPHLHLTARKQPHSIITSLLERSPSQIRILRVAISAVLCGTEWTYFDVNRRKQITETNQRDSFVRPVAVQEFPLFCKLLCLS